MAIVINGSGTVTGLSVGGLPDGTVDTDTLANTTVTAAKVAADVATQAELDAAAFNPNAAVVFNESGADADFRVESDTHTHALFVEGTYGRVGIGADPGGAEVALVLSKDTTASPAEQPGIRFIDTSSGDHYQIYNNAGKLYFRNVTDGATIAEINGDGMFRI